MSSHTLKLLAATMALLASVTTVSGDILTSPLQVITNLSQKSAETTPAQRETHPPVWQKGITYTHLFDLNHNLLSRRSRLSLMHIRSRLVPEWIALNPFGYQSGSSEPHLYYGDDPPDTHLLHAIRVAHQLERRTSLV